MASELAPARSDFNFYYPQATRNYLASVGLKKTSKYKPRTRKADTAG